VWPDMNIRMESKGVYMETLQKTDKSQTSGDPADKRSCPRYPFSPPVEALDIQADIRIIGRLSDIARNGCYMETISPFAAKAAVTLTITCDEGRPFRDWDGHGPAVHDSGS
jgi:hypothetical protein